MGDRAAAPSPPNRVPRGPGKRSDPPPVPGFGRAPARCLPADAGKEIAAARRHFRGCAGNRTEQPFSNIQARIIQVSGTMHEIASFAPFVQVPP